MFCAWICHLSSWPHNKFMMNDGPLRGQNLGNYQIMCHNESVFFIDDVVVVLPYWWSSYQRLIVKLPESFFQQFVDLLGTWKNFIWLKKEKILFRVLLFGLDQLRLANGLCQSFPRYSEAGRIFVAWASKRKMAMSSPVSNFTDGFSIVIQNPW